MTDGLHRIGRTRGARAIAVSSGSQRSPEPARHTNPDGSTASAGQVVVHSVARFRHVAGPADARHTAVLLASAGQSAPLPVQFSARSQIPCRRTAHRAARFEAIRADSCCPFRRTISASSQGPAAGRHTEVLLASAGQSGPVPGQFSAGSQSPADRGTWCWRARTHRPDRYRSSRYRSPHRRNRLPPAGRSLRRSGRSRRRAARGARPVVGAEIALVRSVDDPVAAVRRRRRRLGWRPACPSPSACRSPSPYASACWLRSPCWSAYRSPSPCWWACCRYGRRVGRRIGHRRRVGRRVRHRRRVGRRVGPCRRVDRRVGRRRRVERRVGRRRRVVAVGVGVSGCQ